MIRRSAAGAQTIIDSVRKMQALESGKLALEISGHGLAELVQESLAVLDERLRKKGLTTRIEIDSALRVQVEKTSFVNSVVNNLITNAIKFSPRDGSIELSARLVDGVEVLLRIRDHGIGMPAELRENVFSETGHTSRRGTDGEEGTGFGMPLVKKFVVAYGGEISVESSEAPAADPGTCVSIHLRAAA
jgi:signal transduction histidine kinase